MFHLWLYSCIHLSWCVFTSSPFLTCRENTVLKFDILLLNFWLSFNKYSCAHNFRLLITTKPCAAFTRTLLCCLLFRNEPRCPAPTPTQAFSLACPVLLPFLHLAFHLHSILLLPLRCSDVQPVYNLRWMTKLTQSWHFTLWNEKENLGQWRSEAFIQMLWLQWWCSYFFSYESVIINLRWIAHIHSAGGLTAGAEMT